VCSRYGYDSQDGTIELHKGPASGCFKNKHVYGLERGEASDANMNDSADNLYFDQKYYLTAEVLDTSVSALHQWIGGKKNNGSTGTSRSSLGSSAAVAVWGLFRV
jgi:hypothetical protein